MMKKSLMSNIKNFVDSNVRQRIDRAAHNNNEFFTDDLLLVERHFEDIRQVCVDAEKKISTLLQSTQANSSASQIGSYTHNVQAGLSSLSHNIAHQTTNLTTTHTGNSYIQQSTGINDMQSKYQSNESLSNTNSNSEHVALRQQSVGSELGKEQSMSEGIPQRHKRLPVVRLLRFLSKTSGKLKPDSLLGFTLTHCTQLQTQLTKLFLKHEQNIENQCLRPIQHILEVDVPNVVKLRKAFIKSHNDLESLRSKFNGASHKQQQQAQQVSSANSYTVTQSNVQQINVNKLEQLKKELDEALMRYEQAKDTYESEIYGFVCRETELVNLVVRFYQLQADYHNQVGSIIHNSMPTLTNTLASMPRQYAFGTELSKHLRFSGRTISPILELCVYMLHCQGLKEEGLFRIPGSSIKIKKLKNAINAWFVNLRSLNELDDDQVRLNDHSCVVALHDLFKNVVGKSPNIAQQLSSKDDVSPDNDDDQKTLNIKEQQMQQNDSEIILDVHSIAGLLKLYLRELPEPLFTYDLYNDWIDALDPKSNTSSRNVENSQKDADTLIGRSERNHSRCEALKDVIARMPRCYYENLRHLINFLHLLALHQRHNKMTSTNLAIAMAPSLIWPKGTNVTTRSADSTENIEVTNQQSLSMSSFGTSASLHVLLLDTIISNANNLFPQTSIFTLPGFDELSLRMLSKNDGCTRASDRPLKSTSPAGLSISSSSSFSSNASNPVNNKALSDSLLIKTHNRKESSMEGLVADQDNESEVMNAVSPQKVAPPILTLSTQRPPRPPSHDDSDRSCPLSRLSAGTTRVQRQQAFKSSRPVSVRNRGEDHTRPGSSKPSFAPEIPPVPLARSHHAKRLNEGNTTELFEGGKGDSNPILSDNQRPSQKPPAPPIPAPPVLVPDGGGNGLRAS